MSHLETGLAGAVRGRAPPVAAVCTPNVRLAWLLAPLPWGLAKGSGLLVACPDRSSTEFLLPEEREEVSVPPKGSSQPHILSRKGSPPSPSPQSAGLTAEGSGQQGALDVVLVPQSVTRAA